MKMNSMLLVLACLGFTSALTQRTYCGRRLAIALDLVCEGNLVKRSEMKPKPVELQWPLIDEQRAFGLGYRHKRQVVAECCEKPCTTDELATYCHY